MSVADHERCALVVEDDALIRMDAAAILEDAGYRVLEAGGSDEALAVLADHCTEIDVLFTDVDMPGSINGFGLAREAARFWPHMNILVASGRHTPAPGDMPDGAVFVNKPFSAEVVHGRLREILPDDQTPEPLLDLR